MACLSIAAKMEECNVPLLADFPMEDYNFESKTIQRMEFLVLNTLEWQVNFITPFRYLHYFISKFRHKNEPRNVVPIHLIFAVVKGEYSFIQLSTLISIYCHPRFLNINIDCCCVDQCWSILK